MKTFIAVTCGLMVSLAVSALFAQSPSASTPIPVEQEPRHRLVFADERLRVLEVRIAPGDTTLEHRHDYDLATVNIENGPTRTRDRGADWGSVRPRAVGGVNVNEYTGKSTAHVVQSVGDRAYRLTGVENLKAGAWSTYPPIDDAGARVVADTRAFRAYEVHLTPGQRVVHTHPVPVVVVFVTPDVVALPPDGSLSRPGDWTVVPPGVGHLFAAGRASATVVEIEVR